MADIKRMSSKEFQEKGYLQEVNRQFLHPLGLALEVIVDYDTGDVSFGSVWDYRDDPEGMRFTEMDEGKAARISVEWAEKEAIRVERFGYVIQPTNDKPKAPKA